MSALKRITVTALALLAFQAAAPARAASLEVWSVSGWSQFGSVDFEGPVQFSYIGLKKYCNMRMSLWIVNGSATVVSASFTGGDCSSVVPQALPWSFYPLWPYPGSTPPITGAPVMTPPLYSVNISGVRIALGPPLNVTCPSTTGTATMTAYLDHDSFGSFYNNRLVFDATLGPCRFQTDFARELRASAPLRVI